LRRWQRLCTAELAGVRVFALFWSRGVGANGAVRVHGTKANQGRVRAALQEAHHGEAAARAATERRRPAFRYLGYATAYDI
jgi:hypothetical protein